MAKTISMEVAEKATEPLSRASWQSTPKLLQKAETPCYLLFQELHMKGIISHARDFSPLNLILK